MRQKKRELHELPNTEMVKSGTIKSGRDYFLLIRDQDASCTFNFLLEKFPSFIFNSLFCQKIDGWMLSEARFLKKYAKCLG